MQIRGKKEKTPLGLYIHVPFCRSKCQYCDSYSLPGGREGLMEGYLTAIRQQIRENGPRATDYRVDTVYFGGGTPSYFGQEGLASIMNTIRRHFDVAPDAEITFEANPDSVNDKLLKRLKAEGFNRVSLGVQCDDDVILKKLGRPHNYGQVVTAVRKIRSAGFKNLSLDLIYGLPGQTLSAWRQTLENVLTLQPEHMSCYGLQVEEGTPLYEYREIANLPDDDAQADMYMAAVEILEDKGYKQYEISNFARRGHRSAHNMKYWMGGEYIGFGPGASSDFAGKRYKVEPNLEYYVEQIKNGGPILCECDSIPPRERAGEYVMLRLRTTEGMDGVEYTKNFLLPFESLERLLEDYKVRGLARQDEGRWMFTPKGFLISNTLLGELLEAQEQSTPLAKRR